MKLISSIVLLLVFVIFAATLNMANPDPVAIKFYIGFDQEVHIFMLLAVPFAIGLVLGVVIMSISVMRNKMKVGKTKRELSKVEKEVQNLRSAPITEPMKDEIQS